MAIKIDIHSIANANGTGTPQPFVKMIPEPARTAEELEEEIQRNCTLTRSDVRAVLTALHDIVGRDLAERGTIGENQKATEESCCRARPECCQRQGSCLEYP